MRLTLALCLLAAPVVAQEPPPCGDREHVVANLAEQYGETLQSIGMAAGDLIKTYASTDSGTWTIIRSMPDGTACLIAAGDMFDAGPFVVKPMGEPT